MWRSTVIDEELVERLRLTGDTPIAMFDEHGEPARTCASPACREFLVRRPKERPSDFAKRKYCNPQCHTRGKTKHEAFEARECKNPKCPKQLEIRAGEKPSAFVFRQYCNEQCKREGQAAAAPPRRCAAQGCTVELRRRPEENAQQWRYRRWCSPECEATKRRRIPEEQRERKVCAREGCDRVFVRNPHECSPKKWESRSFCSHECVREAQRATAKVKPAPKPRPVRAVKSVKPAQPKPKQSLTVFGDKPPVEPWRPGSWRKAS
jgi:hypothetical protein